jgi:hypothetical protein
MTVPSRPPCRSGGAEDAAAQTPAKGRRLLLAGAAGLALTGCASLAPSGSVSTGGDGLPPPSAESSPFALWQPRTFPGKRPTLYREEQQNGRPVLRADARSSASVLRRTLRIEPADLGLLQFSWRVPEPLVAANLRDRDAEDAPVRVVLAFDGDLGRLTARERLLFELAQAVTGEAPPYATLMYVWDRHAAAGDVVASNSTGRIRKLVVDGAGSPYGPWRTHARDVRSDFAQVFGEPPGALLAVGVMTDTDNTRGTVRAWYGPVSLDTPDGRRLLG